MNGEPPAIRYPDIGALSADLAQQIADGLRSGVAARGVASLVVSGGRSPVPLFEHLRGQPLDWSRVCVALADERWVDPRDPSSNERLVRDVLLKDAAAAARFVGLKNGAPTPELGAREAWEAFGRVPRPFDAVVLGMGDDGHTASLFPGSPGLAAALDASAAPACVAMRAPAEPCMRLSLNLAALLDSRRIVILITGESKWRTYAAASGAGPPEEMPVRKVLLQKKIPVDVIWSP